MDKYRKVQKPKEASPADEIRVTGLGRVSSYVTYAAKLFNEMNRNSITIRATGKAVSTAVSVAEVVKRRFKGLHQLATIGVTQLVNEYEPLEEGLDKIEETRTVSFISIQLARDQDAEQLDTSAPGYQAPLDESLVKELDPSLVSRTSRSRPRGRGRGRGFSRNSYLYGGRGGRGGGGGGGYYGRGRRGGGGGAFEGQMQPSMMPPPMMNYDGPPRMPPEAFRGRGNRSRGVGRGFRNFPPGRGGGRGGGFRGRGGRGGRQDGDYRASGGAEGFY